ncbi:MAG: hypothetical protein ACJAZ2_001016 [Glaciecola sp.]|jgi:hypothetical protein
MLLIFVQKTTSRLNYAVNLVLRDIIQTTFRITTNQEEFEAFEGPKFAYQTHSVDDEFLVQSHPLLFENGIVEQELTAFDWEGTKAFFSCSKRADFEFDVFAASFYFTVRYEEYLPHKRDEYNRFEAEQSVANQHNLLKKPVVNIWCEKFWDSLKKRFPELSRSARKYEFITTIDIDNAYLYGEKGFVRSIAGYLNDVLSFNVKSILKRTMVLLGKAKDPYDTYEYQLDIIQKYKAKFIYFLLLGDYGKNDKNVPISNMRLQALIRHLADYAQVGVHPSYGARTSFAQLEKEVVRLSPILKKEITQSRQHFLQLQFPDTYRNLIDLDILNDYTMGYASHYGFRSGLCTPYYFYDLDLEIETSLLIHPFAVMDSTLQYYMGVDPEVALEHLKGLVDEVKKVNGTFISTWHNESLNNEGIWKGWRSVFEKLIVYGEK